MCEKVMKFECPRTCPIAGERWCRFRRVTDAIGRVKVDSHVAKIDVEVTDLEALAVACERLGLELRRGQKTYRWFGEYVGDSPLPDGLTQDDLGKCEHAIAVKALSQLGTYEIGIISKPDGGYDLLWDFFAGGYGLEAVVGEGCKKLISEYCLAAAEKAAEAHGWLYERTSDGMLIIHHPSGGTLTVTPGGVMDANGFIGQACHAAILDLGIPIEAMTGKPELSQVPAHVLAMAK